MEHLASVTEPCRRWNPSTHLKNGHPSDINRKRPLKSFMLFCSPGSGPSLPLLLLAVYKLWMRLGAAVPRLPLQCRSLPTPASHPSSEQRTERRRPHLSVISAPHTARVSGLLPLTASRPPAPVTHAEVSQAAARPAAQARSGQGTLKVKTRGLLLLAQVWGQLEFGGCL